MSKIIINDAIQLDGNIALDSRSVLNNTQESEIKEKAESPFDGEVIYLSKLKKYYAITSLNEDMEINTYVQISMPMIDINGKINSSGSTTINDIWWNPAEIMFYDSSNGHKYNYNKDSIGGLYLVSEPFYDTINSVAGYYITRVPIIYTAHNITTNTPGNIKIIGPNAQTDKISTGDTSDGVALNIVFE